MGVRIGCLLIGYAFGLIQTSYFISKAHGFDIRDYGSGNAGTTNMVRTMGTKWGLATFAVDFLKAVLAVWVAMAIFGKTHPDIIPLIKMYAACGAILGHDFPFFLNFRGGKGVATSVGFIAVFDPIITVLAVITFFAVFLPTHYVSAASLSAYAGLFIEVVLLGLMGHFHMTHPHLIELDLLALGLTVLCFVKHRTNIHRLMTGTERKTYLKKHGSKTE